MCIRDRVYAVGNAGNQIKVRGNATIENSLVIGQCGYFNGFYDMVEGDHCRACLLYTSRCV